MTYVDVHLTFVSFRIRHVDHVHRLVWRPGEHGMQLASCSEDGTLRLFTIEVKEDHDE